MNDTKSQSRTIDVHGAAELLGIRVSTVRKYVLTRHIPHFKVGSRVVFDEAELLRWRSQFHVEAIA